jgi:hypothetical protein
MMYALLSLLLLYGTIGETITVAKMPPVTPEIKKFLDDLGDNSFITRERATAALQRKGYNALRGLELFEHNLDPEIASRVGRLLDNYYNPKLPKNKMPGILRIPVGGSTLKWKGGKYVVPGQLRKELYMLFWGIAKPEYTAHPWHEVEIAEKAMSVLVKRMLRYGVPKATIEEWLAVLASGEANFQSSDFEYNGGE